MFRTIKKFTAIPRLRLRFGALVRLAALAAIGLQAQPAVPIRWSTIGNSITEGSGYPAKLQKLLGPAYKVENHGVSGTTMLKAGNFPYWTKGKFTQVFAFTPDIVTVKLGPNDSKPANWPAHKGEFLADVKAMVDTLAGMATKPMTFLCYPVPAFQKNGQWVVDGINDPAIKNDMLPLIKQASEEKKTGLIDLHKPLENRGDLFAGDGVHPDGDKAGSDSIAAIIYRAYKAQVTRIACVGNSITNGLDDNTTYPLAFNKLLGRDYLVYNAGDPGRTLLRKGDAPYYQSTRMKIMFAFQPNIITIKLGTNDSKTQNWDAHKDEFIADMNWLIDTLSTMPTKPRIILLTPVPAWKRSDGSEAFGIRGEVIKNEIIPKLKQVAQARGLTLIDLHTPFLPYQSLTIDGVHPSPAGLDTVGHILYRAFKSLPGTVSVRNPSILDSRSAGKSPWLPTWNALNPLAPTGFDATGRRQGN